MNKLICGDALAELKKLPDEYIDCVVTSPPYWGLRDNQVKGQLGLEATPELYVEHLVEIFREVRRVLKSSGTLWLVLGDSYAGSGGANENKKRKGVTNNPNKKVSNIKQKDLVGIPWSVAFALRADGWFLRQDIIWCLSGGAYVYAKTQKGVLPMMIRDIKRLKPSTVQLWNGNKWTNLLGISKSKRQGSELEIVLRSGERISCTPAHKFPTSRGLLEAGNINKGDIIESCRLPDVENPRDCIIDDDAAWFAGLYIAEGSRSEDTIQIAGHSKESARWKRLQKITHKFGGSITRTMSGNCMFIRIYGKILNTIIDELVSGKTAKNKCFSPVVWKYSNVFISSMLYGYLQGDGHWDKKNNRWRLGFCRNYNLERDLRCACARLGLHLVLKLSTVKYNGGNRPTFRGEIRIERSGHFNQHSPGEVVEIRNACCRELYDIGIEDKSHLFALASGILTHNSKPNPMPESIRDRCTRSHEYIFLLSKNRKYYYDNESIKEPCVDAESYTGRRFRGRKAILDSGKIPGGPSGIHNTSKIPTGKVYLKRNKRDVFCIPIKYARLRKDISEEKHKKIVAELLRRGII